MSAWSRLYQDHYERVYRHVRALTGDAGLSEELVQETFVQALLKIASFDGRSMLSTWLHGVAINVVRNHWRSQRSTAKAHARLEVIRSLDAGVQPLDGARVLVLAGMTPGARIVTQGAELLGQVR